MTKPFVLFLCVFCSMAFTATGWADNSLSTLHATPSKTTESETTTKSVEPSSYIYDLKKLIIKSRENIKRVNEKIKGEAVLKRNQQREERARQYYQKGIQLSQEGKLQEARDYFEKAIRITEHPEMAHYVQESARRFKAEESALKKEKAGRLREAQEEEKNHLQETETAYEQAVSFYHQKKFRTARDTFEHVDEMYPDYKATRSYLKIVDEDIMTAEALQAKQQQKEMERQQKEAEVARQKEKETWRRDIEAKEKERKEQLRQQANTTYNEAVRLYKDRKYKEAKEKFQEVEWVIPDYKATDNYLIRLERDIEREQKQTQQEKAKALEKQRWQEIVAKKKMEEQKKRLRSQQLEEQAEFLYQPAVALFNKKMMKEALEKFNEVEKIMPNYKSTRSYILHIGDFQKQQELKERVAKQKTVQKEKQKPLPKEAEAKKPQEKIEANPITPIKEEETRQAQLLADLAARSAKLYNQIADLANNTNMVAQKRLAKLGNILNSLQQERDRTLKQIYEQGQRQHLREVQQSYGQAITLLRAKNFEGAKAQFEAIERLQPNFKSTRQYLSHIEENRKKAQEQALAERTQRELAEEKALEDQYHQARQTQQRQQLVDMAKKAETLNEEILTLAKAGDYAGAKVKFDQLEQTMADLKGVKEAMSARNEKQELAQFQTNKEQIKQEVIKQQDQERQRREQLHQDRWQALQQKRAQEQKRREALRQQKQEQRQKEMERRRQEAEQKERARLEKQRRVQQGAKRKEELEKVSREGRKKPETLPQAMPQESGRTIDAMYQEAVDLYKAGNYSAALKRFLDVQHLMPNYKDTDIFLQKFQNFSTPPVAPNLEKAARGPSRAEEISKTLDLFDSNAQ